MAGTNEVLVKFKGDNADLKKTSKDSQKDIDDVAKKSQEADGQLKKAGDSGSDAGDKISKGFKAGAVAIAAVGVAAVAAIGKLASESIKAFAQYEQLSGGVDKLFGAASDAVMENAKDAYKNAGLSANAYMESVTGFSASLISGLSGDTAKAAEFADKAIRDMSDNANTYGTDMESIQRTYQGFAKGQFAMLDNLKLGYGGSASEMARLINDSGVLGDTMVTAANVSEVSMDKMIDAIHQTQVNMGIAGTTAKEAATTISGSLASTQAAWTNTLASFASGDDNAITEALNGLIESAGNFVGNISAILPEVLSGVTNLISALIPKLPALFQELLPPLIEGVVSVLNGLVDIFPDLIDVLVKIIPDLVDGLVDVFLGIVDALPEIINGFLALFSALATALLDPKMLTTVIQAISTMILSLVNMLVTFIKNPANLALVLQGAITLLLEIVKALPQIIIALVAAIPEIIKSLVTFLTDPATLLQIFQAMITLGWELIKAIPEIILGILTAFGILPDDIKQLFSQAVDKVKEVWDGIVEWFKSIPDKIVSAFGSLGSGIKNLFTSAVDGIKDVFKKAVNWIIGKINGLIGGANKIVEWIPGVDEIPKIPEIARGGYINYGAGGGVSGAGTSMSDSIPAMLSNGEFVVRAAGVKRFGIDNLNLINEGRDPQGTGQPIVGQIIHHQDADPLVLAQQIGALVRFA